jgi:hypothetical protein
MTEKPLSVPVYVQFTLPSGKETIMEFDWHFAGPLSFSKIVDDVLDWTLACGVDVWGVGIGGDFDVNTF